MRHLTALALAALLAGCEPDAPPPLYVSSGMDTPPGHFAAVDTPSDPTEGAPEAGHSPEADSEYDEHLDAVAEDMEIERVTEAHMAGTLRSVHDRDCRDFASQHDAQAFFDELRPHDLPGADRARGHRPPIL